MSEHTVRVVVVTGASTGIGWAVVETLVQQGVHAVGTVRRHEDAARLRSKFGDRVTPVIADVTDPASLQAAAATVRQLLNGATLFGLVNNAGIALGGPLLEQPIAEVRDTFEVNVFGVLEATRAFAPLLGTEPGRTGAPGRIVTIGSISGRMALPFLGAYSASKHAVKAFNEALRRELQLFGIEVVLLEPGPVITPIWDKGLGRNPDAYAGTPYTEPLKAFGALTAKSAAGGLPASAIGEATWKALTVASPPTRRVLVAGRFLNFTLPSLLSERLFDRILGKLLGLRGQHGGRHVPGA